VRTIFIVLLSLVNFHKTPASAQFGCFHAM